MFCEGLLTYVRFLYLLSLWNMTSMFRTTSLFVIPMFHTQRIGTFMIHLHPKFKLPVNCTKPKAKEKFPMVDTFLFYILQKLKLRGLSPQANYTDRATVACR
jgi:hypothetical protein